MSGATATRWGDSNEPVEELPAEQVQRIIAHLETLQDCVGLTPVICKKFQVSRKQLHAAGFTINHRVIVPPGFPEPEINYEDLYPDLTEEKKQAIIEYLESVTDGRFTEVGDINSWFEVRTPQLKKAGFMFSEQNAHGASNLAPPGADPPEMPLTGAEMSAKGISTKGMGKGPTGARRRGTGWGSEWTSGGEGGSSGNGSSGDANGWSSDGGWGGDSHPMMGQMAMMMGCMMATMKGKIMGKGMGKGDGMMGKGKGKGKGKVKDKDPNAPNPFEQPIDDDKALPIMQFLDAQATKSAPLQIVARKFKVGKRQLEEAGFVAGPPNEDGQISISPPGFDPPPPVEKRRKTDGDAAEGYA